MYNKGRINIFEFKVNGYGVHLMIKSYIVEHLLVFSNQSTELVAFTLDNSSH